MSPEYAVLCNGHHIYIRRMFLAFGGRHVYVWNTSEESLFSINDQLQKDLASTIDFLNSFDNRRKQSDMVLRA